MSLFALYGGDLRAGHGRQAAVFMVAEELQRKKK